MRTDALAPENAVAIRGLEVGDLRGLVLAAGRHRQDVDDGLGAEAVYGGSIRCVQLNCPLAQRKPAACVLAGEPEDKLLLGLA